MASESTICVFGDSTAWGAWDLERGGWVNRLWFEVANRDEDYVEVYNLSISGGTTETILARFEAEAKIRNADALIFQTGGNDAAWPSKSGPNQVPLAEFEHNIAQIITRAKVITPRLLFIGFKNVDEARATPVAWADFYYYNAEISRYGEAMGRVCEAHQVPYLDVFGLLANDDLEDGVHPNASGHHKIFTAVREFLITNKWI